MPTIPDIHDIREAIRKELHAAPDDWGKALLRQIEEAARPAWFARPFHPEPDAAEYLGVSRDKIKRLRREGKVPEHHRDGHLAYYRREDLDAFIAGGRAREGEGVNGQT